MRKLFLEARELGRVLKNMHNIKKLGKKFKAKIEISKQGEVNISSKEKLQEYLIEKMLEAVSLGFSFNVAMQIEKTDYEFKKINIKDYVKAQNQERAKARLIGPQGKTKTTIEELSDCNVVLSNHTVAIIGLSNNVETALRAIESLLRGSRQANIFSYLERNRARLKALEEEEVEKFIEEEGVKKQSNHKK
ncbi:MAG: KH domain-containing protein [Candidatus Pacearchaeota archaeon]